MRTLTRTIRELKGFKYFHHIFDKVSESSYDIYGYYIDMRFANHVLVRSFLRYAFPYEYKEKYHEMRIFPIIFLHQQRHEYNGTYYHTFLNGFTIFGIMEQIIKERKEDEKKSSEFNEWKMNLDRMNRMYLDIAYIRDHKELLNHAELIDYPIIDHLNLIR